MSIRNLIKSLLRLLPGNSAYFIYAKLLHPKPLRWATNKALKRLIPTSIDIPEGTVVLNKSDAVVSGALALGVYENYFSEVFRQRVKPGSTVIDIGANIGYYTVIAAKHCQKVLAFEPEPENIGYLRGNVEANGLYNVEVLELALSDREGRVDLYLNDDNKGKHSLIKDSGSSISIKSQTLDSLIKEGHGKIGLIKLDVEGWEAKVLLGMKKTITAWHPDIMLEFVPRRIIDSGEDPDRALRSLVKEGYKLYEIHEGSQKLLPVADITGLIAKHRGFDDFVNILATAKEVEAG